MIRGLDRNRTIVDGEDRRLDGISVTADGVAVENLTVRRFLADGVLFSPGAERPGEVLTGWRGSYLTASNNGLYGVYALGARAGRFDHVYASGHPDSGVYIGQCSPCDAVVTDSVAEHNMVGFEATNASGNVSIIRSVWQRNRVGVALNSQRKERLAPQHDMAVVGNLVADNDDAGAPRGSRSFGLGVVLAGAQRNTIARNRIVDHAGAGIVLQASVDAFRPEDNRVVGNVLEGNARRPRRRSAGARPRRSPQLLRGRTATGARCPATSSARLPCDRPPAPVAGRPLRALRSPPQVDYRRVAAAPAPAADAGRADRAGAAGARVARPGGPRRHRGAVTRRASPKPRAARARRLRRRRHAARGREAAGESTTSSRVARARHQVGARVPTGSCRCPPSSGDARGCGGQRAPSLAPGDPLMDRAARSGDRRAPRILRPAVRRRRRWRHR